MAAICLTEKDSYETGARPPCWLGCCSPTALFYSRIVGLVFWAAHFARKGIYDNRRWIRSSLFTVRSLECVGGAFEIRGLDVVRRLSSPCVFIGNHMSILETFVLPCLIQPHRDVTFVVKESLIRYPVFGHVMRSRRPIVVGRSNPREDLKEVLQGGQKRLEAGISIVIFPQTTRSVRFDPRQFNSLGIKLAKRADVPAVPFALKTDAWGLGRKLKDFGPIRPEKTVHIEFGEPLRVKGSGKEEHQRIVAFIEEKLGFWN
jgi:1-acyl-sn-glycerol-3-phosphate acyltransferase